jgi:hypothetical protein
MKKQIGSVNEGRGTFGVNPADLAKSVLPLALLALWANPSCADSASAASPYPNMPPVEKYLMPQADEITLARSAAPPSISDDATILVLGRHGFETAVKGTNGFVCYVSRGWDNDVGNAEFWSPNALGPICANPATVRSVLPYYVLQRAQWVMSGVSKDEIIARTKAEIAAKQITAPEAGSMSFMMSKNGHLNDHDGHWHPHVMFWGPPGPASNWGADLPGSQIFSDVNDLLPYTMYFIPVRKWSDGTLAEYPAPPAAATAKPETHQHR